MRPKIVLLEIMCTNFGRLIDAYMTHSSSIEQTSNTLPPTSHFQGISMTNTSNRRLAAVATFLFTATASSNPVYSQEIRIEEIMVVAEKRDESLQDVSQAITAITELDLETRNINSFVDLSALAPGLTVSKNEGFKTVVSIRGVGNETNQNAVAAPSVAYHMDGIFIASPFSLQSDFIDVERIEVLRGPQGTLFGQNSTGGAINVVLSLIHI